MGLMGDGFRVLLPDGRLETFRLYFVDTTDSRSRGKRSDEQAAYFTGGPSQSAEKYCLSAEDHKAEDACNRRITTPFRKGIQWRSYRLADRSSTTT